MLNHAAKKAKQESLQNVLWLFLFRIWNPIGTFFTFKGILSLHLFTLQTFKYPANDADGIKGVWKRYAPHGIAAPDCRETQFSRDNHLGNGLDGQPNRYNWTVPELNANKCALRIRYIVWLHETYNIMPYIQDAYFTSSSSFYQQFRLVFICFR